MGYLPDKRGRRCVRQIERSIKQGMHTFMMRILNDILTTYPRAGCWINIDILQIFI